MAIATAAAATTPVVDLPPVLEHTIKEHANWVDRDRVREAYRMARDAHAGQRRASGESYVTHAVSVATIVAELRLDSASIIGGLIHDVVEDTAVDLTDVEAQFGPEVAAIVDGVTKIGRVHFRSNTEHQAENYRKLLVAMAQEARVIFIKMADRLHNMRTLEHLSAGKRRRIALETRNIYAPIAHRLGLAAIKWELEDLAFKFLEPASYIDLKNKIHRRRKERERQILELRRPLIRILNQAKIPYLDVSGRPKHLWSIHKKIVASNLPFEEVQDLLGLRVITPDSPEPERGRHCYAALGAIHGRWTPLQERIRDYIATPKSNGYKSLHTTVFGPGGRRYEIQIRTRKMHKVAEYGIAAHWSYKDGGQDELGTALKPFREMIESPEKEKPEEFIRNLRLGLFLEEIFVFTPRGDVKRLPRKATPIDFAFSVHTEIGIHCAGARVNGRIAPLSRELQNGDTVEIIVNSTHWPNRDWLNFVKTTKAKGRIRHWIRKREFASALQLGADFLKQELRKRRLPKPKNAAMEKAAERLSYPDFDHLQAALGRGELGAGPVLKALFPERETAAPQPSRSALRSIAARIRSANRRVRIHGVDNLMTRYSRCCQPLPGDEVIGFVTVGRGVSIHRNDCSNVLNLSRNPERRIEITWVPDPESYFLVSIHVRAADRRGLLSDVSRAITDSGTDIQNAQVRSDRVGMTGEFVVAVRDRSHLRKVLKSVKRVAGVMGVQRWESFGETGAQKA